MKKLLIGTALASAMLVSTIAQAETKVSGYYELNSRTISDGGPTASANSANATISNELDINIQSTNELDNGMTLGVLIGTTSEGGSSDHANWGTDSIGLSITSGDTTFDISTDRGNTIDMVHDVVPNPVDQPADNHGSIGYTSVGSASAGASTDIQDAAHMTLTQKFDGGTVAVTYMPSDGNKEELTSSTLNTAADHAGYSIAGKFEVMEGLTLAAGYEKETGYENRDAMSNTYGVTYSAGALSVGAQKTKNETGTNGTGEIVQVDVTATHYGIAYKVSDALTVGVAIQKMDKNTATHDEEYQQIEAAYSLGALGIGVSYGQVENIGGTTNQDADQLMIRLTSKL